MQGHTSLQYCWPVIAAAAPRAPRATPRTSVLFMMTWYRSDGDVDRVTGS